MDLRSHGQPPRERRRRARPARGGHHMIELGRVWTDDEVAVLIQRRDLIVGPHAPELDHVMAASSRSSAAPTLARRLPARSKVHTYFFTALCLSLSTATYVRPTGFPGVAPPGPAMPVMPRPIFAPKR